jgi:hypothetical protein
MLFQSKHCICFEKSTEWADIHTSFDFVCTLRYSHGVACVTASGETECA